MILVVLFMLIVLLGISNGIEYKVGDAPGWVDANVDYHQWASNKPFHVHDILIFEYDPHNHNVVQVNRSSYESCNTGAPMATYASGRDSVVIRGPGHYYYICGFEGHCQAGQKIDIRVLKVGPAASIPIPIPIPIQTTLQSSSSSAAPLPLPSSFTGPMAPTPSITTSSNGHPHNAFFSFTLALFLILLLWASNDHLL